MKEIQRKRGWVLVEWEDEDGISRRSWITESMLEDPEDSDPSQGLPYGFVFDKVSVRRFTAKELSAELHSRGLWTLEDVESNPQAAMAAILTLARMTLTDFLNKCKTLDDGGNDGSSSGRG